MVNSTVKLLAFLVLGGAALSATFWSLENIHWEDPACPRGIGHGFGALRWLEENKPNPAATGPEKLLSQPNFGATPEAAGDLKAGKVNAHLVSTLLTISKEHSICVQAFKEGHTFLPGEKDGPTIPDGYGEAGGLPNTHYFGRAADIYRIDGKPVQDNGTSPAVLDVGRMLADIPPGRRPDQIIGPPDWTKRLGYDSRRGWILAQDQLELHEDHLHLGYRKEEGTNNTW